MPSCIILRNFYHPRTRFARDRRDHRGREALHSLREREGFPRLCGLSISSERSERVVKIFFQIAYRRILQVFKIFPLAFYVGFGMLVGWKSKVMPAWPCFETF